MAQQETVTRLLGDLKAGRREAFDVLLAQVYSELRQRFPGPLLLIDLLQRPTVQALAGHLADSPPSAPPPPVQREVGEQLLQGRQRLLARRQRQRSGDQGGPGG